MLSSADDKAAEAFKRQDIFFFIIKAHWIIFPFFSTKDFLPLLLSPKLR